MQGMLVETNPLKDKSAVGVIVDYLNDYTAVNGVLHLFPIFAFISLRDYIFQYAKFAR